MHTLCLLGIDGTIGLNLSFQGRPGELTQRCLAGEEDRRPCHIHCRGNVSLKPSKTINSPTWCFCKNIFVSVQKHILRLLELKTYRHISNNKGKYETAAVQFWHTIKLSRIKIQQSLKICIAALIKKREKRKTKQKNQPVELLNLKEITSVILVAQLWKSLDILD